jgi:signal transduction histidine kinase/ActR/RegA family two-component response regulator
MSSDASRAAPGKDIDMASLIARHDWTTSELGAPQNWPNALRTVVTLMLDSSVPMWAAWGPALSIVYNAPYCTLLGDKHPAALGRPLSEVWSEIWNDVSGLVATALSGQAIYQEDLPLLINRHGRKEQTWFTFSYAPVRDDAGKIHGLVCTVWESTEKIRGQQRMQQSEARLLALTQSSSNAIYRMSADWREMLELNGQGFISDTAAPSASWMDNYIRPEELAEVQAEIDRAIRTRSMFELEHRVIRADRTIGWTLSRAVPIFDDAGNIKEWFGAASDVSARKEAESRLLDADRMKDQFLAMLAHELRNPLAPVRNGLQILRVNQDARRVEQVIGMLDRQVNHLVRLVDDLMEVARISSGTLQLRRKHIDLADTLRAALDLSLPAIEKGGHTLQVRFPKEKLWVDGDDVRLAQVFSNLTNNAAKYTLTPGLIEISMQREGNHAVVRVVDDGVGIAREDQRRLFVLFGRLDSTAARGDGLGVGLALARRLLEMHGGSIAVDSEGAGKGSCFTVTLPLSDVNAADASALVDAEVSTLAGMRVMIVDDNRDAADSLATLLGLMGCETSVFYNGAAALEALDAFAPQAALFDIGMPELDGFGLAEAIRSRTEHRNTLLVAVTGWGQPEDRARTRAAGFDHHLVKPVDLQQLERILTETAKRRARGG